MLTLNNSRRYFSVTIGVILLVVILIVGSILFSKQKNTEPREEFIDKIPYIQQEFSISYSKEKDQIYVNVLKEPYEENRQRALKWIEDNGQNPNNLKLFYTPNNVFKELNK